MKRASSTAQPARIERIIPRGEAFRLIGWSNSTGKRRERSDATMPARVLIGPGRYGYREGEWAAYLAALPRVSGEAEPSAELVANARKAGIASAAKRRASQGAA